MAANIPAGPGATEPTGPPKKGYAVQYERLLMEELSLKNTRNSFLKSENADEEATRRPMPPTANELQTFKIRGMIHRASLDGMLIAAQHAADEVKTDPNAVAADYERGLERPEAKNALMALWTMKSRQLEEDDNQIPHSIGSESLARRKRFSSEIGGGNGVSCSKQPVVFETSADDFFSAFPECRRRDDASCNSEVDESDIDDDDNIDNQKPKEKKKQEKEKTGPKDEPIVVTCSSSPPSPERSKEGMVNESNAATRKTMQNQRNQPMHNHQKQPPPVSNSGLSRNRGNQHPPNRNQNESNNTNHPPYQHSQRQQNQSLPGKYTNNPYQRQQQGPQQNQRQDDHQHDPYQNQTLAFDYNDNNSCHRDDKSEPAAKNNSFRTAKELGKNFNDKSQGGNGGGRGGDDDWDNYGSNGDVSSGNNNNHRRIGDGINNRSTSSAPGGPQHMVKAAIRGPKDNLSKGLKRKFQPPKKREGGVGGGQSSGNGNNNYKNSNSTNRQVGGASSGGGGENDEEEVPEELRGLDKELIEKINNEIVDSGEQVTFKDIAGLENAKTTVNELILLPMQRPDIFTGLRAIPKGLLLFGPPGTGKTLIGKAIAHESGATFFSISSSSLTSKWIGEGEKLVRTLFAVASYRSPSVVFIDEVDSMLTQRKADENEASRRIKTEFLVQLDGAGDARQGQVLVIGATNLPHELDDAARRRFVKKLYIPLPEQSARESLIRTLLAKNAHGLKDKQIIKLSHDTDGFSGADLNALCREAAMGPIRQLGAAALTTHKDDFPPISYKHFRQSLRGMNPSVAPSDLEVYIKWNDTYGNKDVSGEDNNESDTGSGDESS